MIKVAIVDDHAVFRIGMKYVFRLAKDVSLVAEGESAADALRIAKEGLADVILLDVRMPGTGGISALEEIRKAKPGQKVLMLTTSDTEEDVFRAVKLGADGYILKDANPDALIAGVRTVAAGGKAFAENVQSIYKMRAEMKSLSPREKEVLSAVAKGYSNKEIASTLSVSLDAIKVHLKHIFEKLEVVDRAEAVATAIYRGIIQG